MNDLVTVLRIPLDVIGICCLYEAINPNTKSAPTKQPTAISIDSIGTKTAQTDTNKALIQMLISTPKSLY